MKLRMNTLSASIAVALLSTSQLSYAGAFGLTTQSLSSRSMALAGGAVNTSNATVLYTNPAGMTHITQPQASAGLALASLSTDISNASSQVTVSGNTVSSPTTATDTNNGDATPDSMVPSAYFVTPLNLTYLKNVSAGIGVYGSFGFHANYEDTFAGRLFGDHSKLKVTTYAPSVAYQVNPTTSVGASVTLNSAEGYLSSATYFTPGNSFSIKGSDTAPGYTLGVLVKPSDALSLGAVYRSKVKLYLLADQGDVKFSSPTTGGAVLKGFGNLRITTPSSTELAASYTVLDSMKVYGSFIRTNWSSIQQLVIGNNLLGYSPKEEIRYKDSNTMSIGADYQINPQLIVRAGVAKDETPTTDQYRSVRVPTANRMLYALGFGYAITPATTLDIGYSMVKEDVAPINQTKQLSPTSANTTTYKADFQTSANIVMLQLNQKF